MEFNKMDFNDSEPPKVNEVGNLSEVSSPSSPNELDRKRKTNSPPLDDKALADMVRSRVKYFIDQIDFRISQLEDSVIRLNEHLKEIPEDDPRLLDVAAELCSTETKILEEKKEKARLSKSLEGVSTPQSKKARLNLNRVLTQFGKEFSQGKGLAFETENRPTHSACLGANNLNASSTPVDQAKTFSFPNTGSGREVTGSQSQPNPIIWKARKSLNDTFNNMIEKKVSCCDFLIVIAHLDGSAMKWNVERELRAKLKYEGKNVEDVLVNFDIKGMQQGGLVVHVGKPIAMLLINVILKELKTKRNIQLGALGYPSLALKASISVTTRSRNVSWSNCIGLLANSGFDTRCWEHIRDYNNPPQGESRSFFLIGLKDVLLFAGKRITEGYRPGSSGPDGYVTIEQPIDGFGGSARIAIKKDQLEGIVFIDLLNFLLIRLYFQLSQQVTISFVLIGLTSSPKWKESSDCCCMITTAARFQIWILPHWIQCMILITSQSFTSLEILLFPELLPITPNRELHLTKAWMFNCSRSGTNKSKGFHEYSFVSSVENLLSSFSPWNKICLSHSIRFFVTRKAFSFNLLSALTFNGIADFVIGESRSQLQVIRVSTWNFCSRDIQSSIFLFKANMNSKTVNSSKKSVESCTPYFHLLGLAGKFIFACQSIFLAQSSLLLERIHAKNFFDKNGNMNGWKRPDEASQVEFYAQKGITQFEQQEVLTEFYKGLKISTDEIASLNLKFQRLRDHTIREVKGQLQQEWNIQREALERTITDNEARIEELNSVILNEGHLESCGKKDSTILNLENRLESSLKLSEEALKSRDLKIADLENKIKSLLALDENKIKDNEFATEAIISDNSKLVSLINSEKLIINATEGSLFAYLRKDYPTIITAREKAEFDKILSSCGSKKIVIHESKVFQGAWIFRVKKLSHLFNLNMMIGYNLILKNFRLLEYNGKFLRPQVRISTLKDKIDNFDYLCAILSEESFEAHNWLRIDEECIGNIIKFNALITWNDIKVCMKNSRNFKPQLGKRKAEEQVQQDFVKNVPFQGSQSCIRIMISHNLLKGINQLLLHNMTFYLFTVLQNASPLKKSQLRKIHRTWTLRNLTNHLRCFYKKAFPSNTWNFNLLLHEALLTIYFCPLKVYQEIKFYGSYYKTLILLDLFARAVIFQILLNPLTIKISIVRSSNRTKLKAGGN